MLRTLFGLVLAAMIAAPSAAAWSRPGHMVSAAIAYGDLSTQDGRLVTRIAEIIRAHPDRGSFEVAAAGTSGADRDLRLMMECARWPDDARQTVYDHPTWHYASRRVNRPGAPGALEPEAPSGQAIEALALNLRVAANPRAPMADRAVALCWVMHVAADMHQPLHVAGLYSSAYPTGDAGGNEQWVIDPITNEHLNLHWFWDGIVHGDDAPQSAIVRAQHLATRFPRTSLEELRRYRARDFAGWSFGESFPMAEREAYVPSLATGTTSATAVALPRAYRDRAVQIGERRIAVAGYRIGDLLRLVASEREGE